MGRSLLPLIIALATLSLAAPIPFISLNAVPKGVLVYGKHAMIEVTLCNHGIFNMFGTAVQVQVKGAMIVGSDTISFGILPRGKCVKGTFEIIPTRSHVMATFVVYAFTTVNQKESKFSGTYAFEWYARVPKLIVLETYNRTYVNKAVMYLNLTNVGNYVANNVTVRINSSECIVTPSIFRVQKIIPNKAIEKKITIKTAKVPNTCKLVIDIDDGITKLQKEVKVSFEKPRISLELEPNNVVVCNEEKYAINASVSLSASGTTLRPNLIKVVNLKGCKTYTFVMIAPKVPVTLNAQLQVTGYSTSKSITIEKVPVELIYNPQTLLSNFENVVKLYIKSNIMFEKAPLEITPSVGSLNTTSIVVSSNKTVLISWRVPSGSKQAQLNVRVLGNEFTLPFVIASSNPSISLRYSPSTLVEGSNTTLKICVRNEWTRTLSDVSLTVNSTSPPSIYYLGSLKPSESKCIKVNVVTPWNEDNYVLRISFTSLEYRTYFNIKIPLTQNPNVAIISMNISSQSLKVGKNVVNMVLKNDGVGWAKNVVVRVKSQDLQYPLSAVPLGDIPPNGNKSIKLVFNVPPERNIENVEISVSYCSGAPVGPCKAQTLVSKIELSVAPYVPPNLQVTVLKRTLQSGASTKLCVEILNDGRDVAVNPSVTFEGSRLLVLTGKTSFTLPNLEPGKSKRICLNVSIPTITKDTTTQLVYNLRYGDPWGGRYSNQGKISLRVLKARIPIISVRPTTSIVIEGENRILRLEISNLGAVAARNVVINVYANGMVIKNPTWTMKNLMPGQRVIWKVYYSIPYGSFINEVQLGVTINYTYPGGNNITNLNFPLSVRIGPKVEIQDVLVSPQKIPPGRATSVAFNVVNSGNMRALMVNVKLEVPKELSVIGTKTLMLESLNPGANVPAAFIVRAKPDAPPGTYPVKIVLTYRFNGNEYTVTRMSSVIVVNPIEAYIEGLGKWIIYAIVGSVAIIIIIIIVIVLRRGRSEEVEAIGE